MAVHKLYDLENEIGTETKYNPRTHTITDRSIGICAALSALWYHNMLNGSGALSSKPGYQRAVLLQGVFEHIPQERVGEDELLWRRVPEHLNVALMNARNAVRFIFQGGNLGEEFRAPCCPFRLIQSFACRLCPAHFIP